MSRLLLSRDGYEHQPNVASLCSLARRCVLGTCHTFTISGSRKSSSPRMGSRSRDDRGPVNPLLVVDSPARCWCCWLLLLLLHPIPEVLEEGNMQPKAGRQQEDEVEIASSGRRAANARRTRDDIALGIDIVHTRFCFVTATSGIRLRARGEEQGRAMRKFGSSTKYDGMFGRRSP